MYLRNRISRFFLYLAFTLAAVSVSPAIAQHGGDIYLTVVDQKIVTSLIDESTDPVTIQLGQRVFESELGDIAPRFSDEPGFDSPSGTFAFPSEISFRIMDALRVWDGLNFDTIPTERMSVSFGPLGPVQSPVSSSVVNGFGLAAAADGSWHRHLEYTLDSPGTTGVYLLQLQLTSSDLSIASSDPFYLVFNQNDLELNHAAATAFVENQIVPEPSSWALACCGLFGIALVAWRKGGNRPVR